MHDLQKHDNLLLLFSFSAQMVIVWLTSAPRIAGKHLQMGEEGQPSLSELRVCEWALSFLRSLECCSMIM